MLRYILTANAVFLLLITPNIAQAASPKSEGLSDIVGTRVYVASRRQEDPERAASATYLITADDLKQMGVRHVADALRTVPGLQVAKIASNKWMVASRGFGEQFSNKLLVLVNGRPVYSNLFSGVLWDQLDIPILDIKQIEVVRGSGASLWGSNAVNGVINIVTKSSQDTLGTQLSATTGFTEGGDSQTLLEYQHGAKITELDGTIRTSLRLDEEPSYFSKANTAGFDDSWRAGSAYFRYDRAPNRNNALTVNAGVQINDVDQTYTFPTLVAPFTQKQQGNEASRNAFVEANWSRHYADDTQFSLQTYLSYSDWEYVNFNPKLVTLGTDSQYDFKLFESWETSAGLGYRVIHDQISSSTELVYSPGEFTAHFGDAFLQTTIPLIPSDLDLTLGSKAETNSYEPFLLSPSAKLAWYPNRLTTVWTSYARAYRIPSRGTRSLTTLAAGTPAGYVGLIPNEDFQSEEVDAFEAGIRLNPLTGLKFDATVFHNEYDNLRTFVPGPALPAPIGVARYLTNDGSAVIEGYELSASYQTSPALRLTGSYTNHHVVFALDPGASDTAFANGARRWPEHMWNCRFAYQISDNITFNGSAYYTAELPGSSVAAYTKLDSNITFEPMEGVEFTFGVDNLLDDRHQEYSGQLFGEPEEVPQIVYFSLKLQP